MGKPTPSQEFILSICRISNLISNSSTTHSCSGEFPVSYLEASVWLRGEHPEILSFGDAMPMSGQSVDADR